LKNSELFYHLGMSFSSEGGPLAENATEAFFMENDRDRFFTALGWWMNGWGILPCQPNTKDIVSGYGPYRGVIREPEKLSYWFRDRKCNVAVVAPGNGVILDFDSIELYERFRAECPGPASSATERTPRGGAHVFVLSLKPGIFDPVPGLEIKRVCLVNPSKVDGKGYIVCGGEFKTIDLENALRGFLTVRPIKTAEGQNESRVRVPGGNGKRDFGLMAKVKVSWPILAYLAFFEPRLVVTGRGRWRSARCPWHDDHRPSLSIDTVRNLWACHACHAAGDVIDWEARRQNVKIGKALKSLAEYAEAVRVEL
jgi:hypothetical protein